MYTFIVLAKVRRVPTDLEKVLKFDLGLEKSWTLKKSAFCPGIMKKLSLKI